MTCWLPAGNRCPTKIAKVEPKKNGIRDLHLMLSGLRDAKIKQITVNCQTDKGPTSWRLDTTDSQDWPLVIRRPGNDISADLSWSLLPATAIRKNFTIMVHVRGWPGRQRHRQGRRAHRSQAGHRSQDARRFRWSMPGST